MTAQKESCIHYEICSSLIIGGFLGCVSPKNCKFYHSSAKSDAVLEEAISICQNLYEHHYTVSMKEHIEGYDDDDQKEVKQNHWIRACGISECIPKLKELRTKECEK